MGRKKRVVRRKRKTKKVRRGSKLQVFRGSRVKTVGGLTKTDVFKNKRGKVVSKKANAHGKKQYKRGLSKWTNAFMKARRNLGVKGFKPCKKGTALYKETKKIYEA